MTPAEEIIPTATAVPVNSLTEETKLNDSTLTYTANVHGSTAGNDCANYFKNPTPAMLERAKSCVQGGILFVSTPNKKGKFTVPKTMTVGKILGDDKIDLSYADFVWNTTTVQFAGILHDLKLTVPRGVRVDVQAFGILGDVKDRQTPVHAGEDAPTIVVKGCTILGDVKIITNETCPPVRIVTE